MIGAKNSHTRRGTCRARIALAGVIFVICGPGASSAADNAQTQCVQDFQAMGVPLPGVPAGQAGIETLCRCQNDKLREAGINPDDLRRRISDDLTKLLADIKDLSPEARTKLMSTSPYMKDMQMRGEATAACITKMSTPGPPPAPTGKQK